MFDNMREKPQQRRAEETVRFIMEATAQVLDGEDEDGFTTNHIAARAGVSIGTLYRYFPNKRTILGYLIAREAQSRERHVLTFLEQADEVAGPDIIRFVVRSALGAFDGRMAVRRRLILNLANNKELLAMAYESRRRAIQALGDKLVETHPDSYRRLNVTEQLCLLGAIAGAINALSLHPSTAQNSEELERHLCTFVSQFFAKGGAFDCRE